jgi:uncharacterized protein
LAAHAGGHPIDIDVSERDLRPQGVKESALRSAQVHGTLSTVDQDLMFRGTITGEFEQPCDRCLEPARQSVEQEVVWIFIPGPAPAAAPPDEEDGEFGADLESERVRYFEGDQLDLGPHVWEEMVLVAPVKYYCRENCRGLCPTCGKNLNEGACECARKEEVNHSGLAALKDLFPNLPTGSAED